MLPYITVFSREINTYYLGYLAAFVFAVTYNLLKRKRYGYSVQLAVGHTLASILYGILGAMLMAYIKNNVFGSTTINGTVYTNKLCLYGTLLVLPLFILLGAKLAKEDFVHLLDYLTPGVFFVLAGSKISCTLFGCCFGKPWSFGFHSRYINATVFPVQPLEAATTILVALCVVIYMHSRKYKKGTAYPFGMILYSSTRFLWEFLRYDEGRFSCGLTLWQAVSLVSVAVGSIWLTASVIASKKQAAE